MFVFESLCYSNKSGLLRYLEKIILTQVVLHIDNPRYQKTGDL